MKSFDEYYLDELNKLIIPNKNDFDQYLNSITGEQLYKKLEANGFDINDDLDGFDRRFIQKIIDYCNYKNNVFSLRPGKSTFIEGFEKIQNMDINLRYGFLCSALAKQNPSERAEAAFLTDAKKENKIKDYTKLPAKGKKCFRLNSSGAILQGATKKDTSKSLDFLITLNSGKLVYISHKYLNEAGGAQDNQVEDVINMLKFAKNNVDENIIFAGVVDGNYNGTAVSKASSVIDYRRKVITSDGILGL